MTDYQDYGFPNAEPSHVFNYLQSSLLAILDKNKNQCILDLGCGNGYLANYLLARGFNIYGTDASEEGIAMAKKTNPNNFFVQDLTTGRLPAALQQYSFDTIISTEVIEHLYNPGAFVEFCKGLLSSKGELIISTPYHGYLKNLLLALLNKWDTHADPRWLGGHIKFWSKNTLSELLTSSGFVVTDFKGCGRVPYLWKTMLIKAQLP